MAEMFLTGHGHLELSLPGSLGTHGTAGALPHIIRFLSEEKKMSRTS